jgi:hypothetical protein
MSLPSVCPMALGKGWNPIFKKLSLPRACSPALDKDFIFLS